MKLNINSARKGNSSYTFSPLSLVTLDFGRLQPIMSFSTLLGDNFSNVVGKGLLRCTPQVFPPFGRMNLKSAAFFVPDSQLFSWASAFHSDSANWRGQAADKVPLFDQADINYYFVPGNSSFLTGLSVLVSSSPSTPPAYNAYDFAYPSLARNNGQTNLNYYRLTPYGWKIYAILKSLGFDFCTFPSDLTGGYTQSAIVSYNSSYISSVPFLAYAKIWNDFFCNSYQSDKNPVASTLQKIYLNKDVVVGGVTLYTSSTFVLSFDLVFYMLKNMALPYESNMYTNAWNNPNDPTGIEYLNANQTHQQSLISPYGSTNWGEFGSLDLDPAGNLHETNVGQKARFSALGHKTLEAFDKFVRRRNLVGSKAVQQLYALFGIEPDEWKKDYVVKLSENSSRVNFSAITSQSDTVSGSNGKPLGAFAGTGLGGFDIQFSYKSNTFGTIVCLAWLNIDPILMHGLSPDTLRVKPLDFYTPDYDGKAYRPIPLCEVVGAKSQDNLLRNTLEVYGFTNMYDDYRTMRDVVAGSFCDDTTRNFAFMRDFTELFRNCSANNVHLLPQIGDVQYWHLDGSSDITNPFLSDASLGDRFWFCVDWNINCTRPILSSENSFDLDGEGSLTINKNGDGMA